MNIFGQTVSVLFALALLAALGMGGYFAIEYIVALFLSMDAQVARVTAVAAVIVLSAAALIARSIRQASRQNIANPFHANKAEAYQLFVDTWSNLLREQPAKLSGISFNDALPVLDKTLALYGSPAVIKAHTAMRASVAESGTQNSEISKQFSKALLEVRKELGSDTSGITPEELTGLVLSDTGQHEVPSVRLVPGTR